MGKRVERSPEEQAVLLEFGERVRGERKARGWTQEDLAEHASMDRTYVGGIERGERNPTLIGINKLALALGESATGFAPCRTRGKARPRVRK